MKHGKHRELYEVRKSTGKTSPLDHEPELLPDLGPYFEAFVFLHTRRARGLEGPCPIQASEIVAFLDLRTITEPIDRRLYGDLIALADRIFLEVGEQHVKERARDEQSSQRDPIRKAAAPRRGRA